MIQMALSYAVEFSLRCQQNKSVDVFLKSRARKCTIWLVQELFREKRRTGRNGEVWERDFARLYIHSPRTSAFTDHVPLPYRYHSQKASV